MGWRRLWQELCAPADPGGLGRELGAAASATRAQNLAATDGRGAGTEAVTTGANKVARLESALHVSPRKSNKKGRPNRTTMEIVGRRYWNDGIESTTAASWRN
ncbi:hypothetical protein NRB_23920 [Novosphingobium sp. 11B]|nr:hypothetical protein GCM10017612_15150 [Novosphingobium resinovorum]